MHAGIRAQLQAHTGLLEVTLGLDDDCKLLSIKTVEGVSSRIQRVEVYAEIKYTGWSDGFET